MRWQSGDESAFAELFPLLYGELRRLARRWCTRPICGCWSERRELASRGLFFAAAAQAMRRILVDHARKQSAEKRRRKTVALEDGFLLGTNLAYFTELDEALLRLAQMDARRAQLVELRFFGGMNGDEIAGYLKVSPATVQRDWMIARMVTPRTGSAGGGES